MKRITIILLLLSICVYSQKNKTQKIGQVNKEELLMTVYDKDSTAAAVVLYEHANYYMDSKNDFKFRTDYYYRIKILDKKAFFKAAVEIPLYKEEEAKDIKGVTYNLDNDFIRKSFLAKNQIFTTKMNESWSLKKFTLPNLRVGSVIEYSYSVLSPYPRIDDWYFQSDIPKIKSEFDAAILGNYKYNIRITGFLKLTKDNQSVKKACLNIPGIGNGACAISSFGMENIPAFKEEDYMLSKKNFISRLSFDLISYTQVNGVIRNYTKTWKDADKTLRLNYLDGQTSKRKFFRNNIPASILEEANELNRAKKVYRFVQNRMNWNGKYWTQEKIKVKNIFNEKSGSVDGINLILYNSLQVAKIESYLVALSTRDNGLPTKLYPMVNDFNYILIKVIIDGKTYFLDASGKNLPFGLIPFKCINGDGRVLDFKKGSYWEKLKSNQKTSINIRGELKFDNEELTGDFMITKSGYAALNERKLLNENSEEDFLNKFETEHNNLEVETYSDTNAEDLDKQLFQKFKVVFDGDNLSEVTTFNIPLFIFDRIGKNPFKLSSRIYPVDYGYPRNYTCRLSLIKPEGYKVEKFPEAVSLSLPNKGGRIIFRVNETDSRINLYYKQSINKKVYTSDEYHYLKEFYNRIIKIQKSTIQLIKI